MSGRHHLHLLPGTPADLPVIFQLECEYITDYEPQNVEAWQSAMYHHLEQSVHCLPRTVVAAIDDEKVGYLFWERASSIAILASIHVKLDYRRHAIGRLLLGHFEENAVRQGCEIAELHVFEGNPAIHFYKMAGYSITGNAGSYMILSKDLLDR